MYRTYAVRVQTDRLLPIMANFACGSVVLFFLLRKSGSESQIFLNKKRSLPPCRRQIGPFAQRDACRVNDCVSPDVLSLNHEHHDMREPRATANRVMRVDE